MSTCVFGCITYSLPLDNTFKSVVCVTVIHVPMLFLKVYGQFYIKLSACKIIGNGVTIVGDVSYPIVGVDIVDV